MHGSFSGLTKPSGGPAEPANETLVIPVPLEATSKI